MNATPLAIVTVELGLLLPPNGWLQAEVMVQLAVTFRATIPPAKPFAPVPAVPSKTMFPVGQYEGSAAPPLPRESFGALICRVCSGWPLAIRSEVRNK